MTPPLAGHTVLLVEDDRGVQRALADALSEAGFTVLAERDGDWALRTFAARPVDIAVLDVLLPGLGGLEVAEELRRSEKGRELPIIISSGVIRAQKGKRELEERCGKIAAWLDKPYQPSKLVAAVQAALKVEPEETDPEARRRRRERARVEAKSKDLSLSSIADLQEAKGVESESQARFRGAQLVRGNLRDTPFSEVLSQLHRWRATGALLLKQDPVKKIVYLREGAPLFVRSNLLQECLGQILVREKMITLAECEESLRRMQTGKRQQGTVLIDMGCISPANLSYALQLQQETKLYDLFTWAEGDYNFNPRTETPSSLVALEMTTAHILLEGIGRAYDGARTAAALGVLDGLAVRLAEDPMDRFQDMGLDADASHFFALIDGRRTAAELLAPEVLGALTVDEGRRLLYALKCAGMVQLGLAPRAPPRVEPHPQPLPGIDELPVSPAAPPPPVSPASPPPPVSPVSPVSPVPPPPERALPEPELIARQQIERLAARAQDLRRGTLYDALGVPRNASEFEVHSAYGALAKETHPDRLGPDASAQARAFAEDIFAQVVRAHDVLSDRRRRGEYEAELRSGAVRSDGDDVARILAAEERFRHGEELLRNRDFPRARAAFAEAVDLYPDEAEFHACLGWTTWVSASGSADAAAEAHRQLDRALQLNPRMDRAYVFRGHIQKSLGKAREAEDEFEKALLCNPGCAEALKELRLSRKA